MEFATEFIQKVNGRLAELLSHAKVDACDFGIVNPLQEGYSYAVKDGGKRIRPMSVYLGALSTGIEIDEAKCDALVDLACMVELVHSYSLVHDDLPAMDNDDYRRGKLSTHKKYGEANGILIGDGLLTLAMVVGLNLNHGEDFVRGAGYIAKGAFNMVTGQALDLADGKKNYLDVYTLKTAELISNSFAAGSTLMGASDDMVRLAKEYGHHLGLAFQLADDLLDDGTEVSLVSEKGREYVVALLNEETEKAINCAKTLSESELLTAFATNLLKRTK